MRRQVLSRSAHLAAAAALAAGALSVSPAALASDRELAGAAWVAASAGTLKVSAASNATLLNLTNPTNVSTIAVDGARRVVWIFAQPTLRALDFSGLVLSTTTIPGTGTSSQLAVRPSDGSVWLGLDSALHNVSAGGQLLRSVSGPGVVKELVMDDLVLWVATAGKVTGHDAVSGAQIGALTDLGSNPSVRDISLRDGHLWVALSGSLRWYSVGYGTTQLLASVSVSGALFIERTAGNSLWVVKSNELVWVRTWAPSNIVSSSMGNPFGKSETPLAVVATADDDLWIGTSKSRLLRGVGSGFTLAPAVTIRDLASFPRETSPPQVQVSSGGWTTDPLVPLGLTFYDTGSGPDPATLTVTPTGKVVCLANEQGATCNPVSPWAEAVWNGFTVSIKDYAGNSSTPATGGIGRDSTPPALAITSPADGAVLTSPTTPITLTYSDASSGILLTSFQIAATGGPAVSFNCTKTATSASCSAVGGFPDGVYTITATIRDNIGNTASRAITVTVGVPVDTTPPTLSFTAPGAGRTVGDATPLLRVAYGDTGGGVGAGIDPPSLRFTRDGQPLAVTCRSTSSGAGCVPQAPLPPGAVSIAATIADLAGNRSPAASVSFSVVAPITEVTGVVRLADGSPAAGAEVFLVGKPGTMVTAAADGSFTLVAVRAYPGERLAIGARSEVVGASVVGGVHNVAPGYPTTALAAFALGPLCALSFSDEYPPGRGITDSNGIIEAITVFDDGTGPALYAAGTFWDIGDVSTAHIARWSGNAWSYLPPTGGVNGEVTALAVFDDGTGPALYAAGSFSSAGGVPASNIARWGANGWSALGSGLSNVASSLLVFDDGSGPALYAAGGFITAGGAPAAHVARWDGFSWTALGAGTDGYVTSLAVFDDGNGPALFAAGTFAHAGGTGAEHAAANVARWDGQQWSALGAGLNSWVETLAAFDGGAGAQLVAAGSFTSAGGTAANHVARWNGVSWSPLGAGLGLDDSVYQLAVFDDGTATQLYAVGSFAGGLLRWDGERWRGVGGGLDEWARSLGADATPGYPSGLLIGGGRFDMAGGVPAEAVARWRRSCDDQTPPTLRITSPLPGSVTPAAAATIAGTLSEPSTLTIGGQSTPVDAQGAFTRSVALVEGANTFAVVATDAAGNSARADVKVLRDSAAPTLRFLYPAAGQTLTTALPRVELAFTDASGADAETLTLTAGALTPARVCAGGADVIRCQLATALPSGSVTLTARVRDLAGNLSAAAQVTVTVAPTAASGTTTVSGSVGLIGGAPIAGARVTVQGQPGATAVSGADGSFLIPGVLATAGQALTVIARLDESAATQVGFVTVAAPVLAGVSNAGRITLRPVCPAAFDSGFVAGYGLDGDYPWKFPSNYDTYFKTAVRALVVYDDGTGPALFVGGSFKQAGGLPANFIAKFDGTRWSALGSSSVRGKGTNNYVQALAVFNDGSGTALYAGGYFTAVDGTSMSGIARWNGTSWSAVGGGIGGSGVTALAVWNNALYAAGRFSSAGGVAARNVAKWNGTTWSALGAGLGESYNNVYALLEHKKLSGSGTALYAGGDFVASGGTAMKRIAAWDGGSWREVGGGVGTAPSDYSSWFNVSALAVWKGDLYAGGWFEGAGANGSVAADAVARWDGRNWNLVGNISGTGCQCIAPLGAQALQVFNDGSGEALYALGDLSSPAVSPRCDALRWNGTAWSAPLNGPYGGSGWGGSALRLFDDPTDGVAAKLFAGSAMAGLVATKQEVKGLATWDGAAWRPVGSGIGRDVLALASFDDGSGPALYAVGGAAKRMSVATPPAGGRPAFTDLPPLGGVATAIAVVDLGAGPELFAGGSFTTPGPFAAKGVARWNGGAWSPVGTGIHTTGSISIAALAGFGGAAGRVLIAAGGFGTADGAPFRGIAGWDGTAWKPLSTGADGGNVYALAEHDDGSGMALYAGGDFEVMGGEPASRIARWNGSVWSPVGNGLGATDGSYNVVKAMAVFDDGAGRRLYAAVGDTAGPGGSSTVMRWDGTSWTALGATFNGAVRRLEVLDDGTGPALYALGGFVKSGATTVNRIARWNGTAWVGAGSDLGSGTVYDLIAFDDGTGRALFAGGRFAYGSYGKRTDYGHLGDSGEVYYLAKLRRPLQCSAPDTTAPTLAITSPAPGAVLDTQTPQIDFSYADAGSGVDSSTLAATANGSPLALACAHGPSSAACTPTAALAEGQVDLSATVRDAAGNTSSSATVAFRISIGAPAISIVSPAEDELLTSATAAVTVAYSAASLPQTLTLATSPSALAFSCVPSGTQSVCAPTSPFPEGRTTLTATIRNGSGQTSPPAQAHFWVDTLPPTLTFLAPAPGAVTNDATPTLRFTHADAGTGIDPATLAVTEGGATRAVACSQTAAELSCELATALAPGSHTLTATVEDQAGRQSAATQVSFEVNADFTAPTITLAAPADRSLTTASQVTFLGNLDEAADLTVNGAAAAVDGQHHFSLADVGVVEGPNRFTLVATDRVGNASSLTVKVFRDTTLPLLAFTRPLDGHAFDWSGAVQVRWGDSGSGIDPASLRLFVDGAPLPATCSACGTGASCTPATTPGPSARLLTATVADGAGNVSLPALARLGAIGDTTPPVIHLSSPADGAVVRTAEVYVSGALSEPANVTVDGTPATLGPGSQFRSAPVPLAPGPSSIAVVATDGAGNSSTLTVRVVRDSQAPSPVDLTKVTVSPATGGLATVSGAAGAVTPADAGTRVLLRNLLTSAAGEVSVAADGSFSTAMQALGSEPIELVAEDAVGNRSLPRLASVPGSPPSPIEPVAGALDPTVPTSTCASLAFIYQGASPVQVGVTAGAIDCARIAGLHGRVLDAIGAPRPGVVVSVLRHAELGLTLTRADGAFDLAVNGGGDVVLAFAAPGLLPVQRVVSTAWGERAVLPDVVMVPPDVNANRVDSSSPDAQVARGSVVTDVDGTRRATLLFLPGTAAQLRHESGAAESLSTITVRATELTVGPSGPAAMPAELPFGTGYTYAVDLSADEATAAGAKALELSQPVPVYLENFLGFPAGTIIPAGYYDPARATWVGAPDGLVVRVLAETNGVADLDVDGSGSAAAPAALAALGIGEPERRQVATLYEPNQSLWRVPVTHFTAWDFNLPVAPAGESRQPNQPRPRGGDETKADKPCLSGGSIIECTNQVLGEVLGIAGSAATLHYASDRVRGRKSADTLEVSLTSAQVPAGLRRVDVELVVAGKQVRQSFPPTPNQTWTYTWDGKDGQGRLVQGRERYTLRLGYVYDGQYRTPGRSPNGSFGGPGGPPLGPARGEVTLWQVMRGKLGAIDARELWQLGGWSLSPHHVYDPEEGVLYRGDGTRRHADALKVVKTLQTMGTPTEADVEPDGSVDVIDVSGPKATVWRIRPTGERERIAGAQGTLPPASGMNALDAAFPYLVDVAVSPEGAVYLLDRGLVDASHHPPRHHPHLWRIEDDGTLTDVLAYWYDDPLAEIVMVSGLDGARAPHDLWTPVEMTFGPDGALYVADAAAHSWDDQDCCGRLISILRVDLGRKVIEPFVLGNVDIGGSQLELDEHGSQGSWVPLVQVGDMTFDEYGDFYFTVNTNCPSVWRRRLTGAVELVAGARVAGTGSCVGNDGDGGYGPQAHFTHPTGIAALDDGSVLIADAGANRIRRVDVFGNVSTIAGTGETPDNGDQRPPLLTNLSSPRDVLQLPDGDPLITDSGHGRVSTIDSPSAVVEVAELRVTSEDGAVIHVFTERGRHLRTENAETGQMLLTFGYDDEGRLQSISDAFGNETRVERDAGTHQPTALVAPFGQHTTLALDGNGYLESIVNPAAERVDLTYHAAGGLLETLTDPNRHLHTFRYDALGRLHRDEDPRGGFTELVRSEVDGSFTVTKRSAEGRITTYTTVELPTGEKRVSTTLPDGTTNVLLASGDGGRRTLTHADGSTARMSEQPDPRFGMQAPVPGQIVLSTPLGKSFVTSSSQQLQTDAAGNPRQLTSTLTVNGKSATSVQDFAARTVTSTSPGGRQGTTHYDQFSRLLRSELPGVEPVTYTYDPRGRLETVAQGSRAITYAYAPSGFVEQVTDPLAHSVRYERDAVGRVTKQVLPDLREVRFAYDDNGNLTSVTPPARPAHEFVPNAVDLPEQYQAPEVGDPSRTTVVQYNLDRQVTQVARPDGQSVAFSYGPSTGRLESFTTPRGATRFTYHPTTGNVASVTDPDGGGLAYAYDGSLPLSVTWSGPVAGAVEVGYDDDFRVDSQRVNGGHEVTFGYDLDGFLSRAGSLTVDRRPDNGWLSSTTLGAVSDTYSYTNFGELQTYAANVSGGLAFQEEVTERDAVGRIKRRRETVGATTSTYAYSYDAVGRLTRVDKDGALHAEYGYDGNSNRTTATDPLGSYAGTYDDQDRLLTYGGTIYAYSANGELRSKTNGGATAHYAYDVAGNLRQVTLADGIVIDYVVDAANRRVGKKVGGTLVKGFLYGSQLAVVAELDGAGAVVSRFVYGPNDHVPAYMVKAGTTYRLLGDHLGSVRLVIDTANGSVVQRLDYDPFGRVLLDTNPGFQPFGFAGGLYDHQTRLVRFGARDYDPETGRWTAKDPIGFSGGDTNLYGYVLSDPINGIDPAGLFGVLDGVQLGLDVVGMIPALGEPADILNGAISLLRGDCVGAALSFGAAVPIAGWAATGAKWGRTAVKYSDEAMAVGNGCLCFTEGTEVLTDQGEKPIEEVDVGDRVLARNEDTGETSYRLVTQTFNRQAHELVRVDVGDDTIEATVEHPFWVLGEGWVKAEELATGDRLVDSSGAEVAVQGLEREAGDFTVHNFTVQDLHNYYVSTEQVLVHNRTCGLTRRGVARTNAADWRRTRDLWDNTNYGDILSPDNRRRIATGQTPIVDQAWTKQFPGDAKLLGERIPMHHIDGSVFSVPLPQSRHLDGHMPGGYRYNPGGPGQSG